MKEQGTDLPSHQKKKLLKKKTKSVAQDSYFWGGNKQGDPPNVPAYSYIVFLGRRGRIVTWGKPKWLEFPGQSAEGKKTAHREKKPPERYKNDECW